MFYNLKGWGYATKNGERYFKIMFEKDFKQESCWAKKFSVWLASSTIHFVFICGARVNLPVDYQRFQAF